MKGKRSYTVIGDDESRARFKFQTLLQDYQELLQETEAAKEKLRKDKRQKLRLIAEVRFLQAKQKSILKSRSSKKQYRLKKRKQNVVPKPQNIFQKYNSIDVNELPAEETNHGVVIDSRPNTSVWLDLNQVSMPNPEDMEEFQLEWEQPSVETARSQSQNEAVTVDLKLSMCRNLGNDSNAMGKRKVSWEDQLALRV